MNGVHCEQNVILLKKEGRSTATTVPGPDHNERHFAMAKGNISRSASSGQSTGYESRRFPGGVEFPCIDFSLPKERVLRRITDTTDNHRAMKFVAKERARCKAFSCCYVIGADGSDRVKIGMSNNPAQRLRALSTGYPERLKVYGLFWSFAGPAERIECDALRAAKVIGIRCEGEWVKLTGERAVEFVLEVAWRKVAFADSREFWEQWTTRPVYDRPTQYWDDERIEAANGKLNVPERGWLHL